MNPFKINHQLLKTVTQEQQNMFKKHHQHKSKTYIKKGFCYLNSWTLITQYKSEYEERKWLRQSKLVISKTTEELLAAKQPYISLRRR